MSPDTNPQQNSGPDPSVKGIWQILPEETPDAFAAFTCYLQSGADTTLAEVAKKTGKSPGSIRNLSWRHRWFERAAAWRQHTASVVLSSMVAENVQHEKLRSARDQIR